MSRKKRQSKTVNLPATRDKSLMEWSFERHQVRTFMDTEGNPWWVLADVCVPLGLEDSWRVASRLDPEVKQRIDVRSGTPLEAQAIASNFHVTCVNEKGLYRVIFGSVKPEAERFQDWVFGEVLPQIRRRASMTPRPLVQRRLRSTSRTGSRSNGPRSGLTGSTTGMDSPKCSAMPGSKDTGSRTARTRSTRWLLAREPRTCVSRGCPHEAIPVRRWNRESSPKGHGAGGSESRSWARWSYQTLYDDPRQLASSLARDH